MKTNQRLGAPFTVPKSEIGEWRADVENSELLNSLFAQDLRIKPPPAKSAWTQYRQSQSTKTKGAVHSTESIRPPEPPMPFNPCWNESVKRAFQSINSQETVSLRDHQQRLPVFFTAFDLKKIYRQRAKILHPDHASGSHLQFIELKKNYQILMDFLKKID